jgi:very-short-patch-repair endonuclease
MSQPATNPLSPLTQAASRSRAPMRSPSPPSGERAGVRGRARDQQQASKLPLNRPVDTFSPSGGEGRDEGARSSVPDNIKRLGGITPHLNPLPSEGRGRGKYRTRTAEARDFARQLRKKSTVAEKRLWSLLRDRRFTEFKFRRQYPCGIYFLDFHCTLAKLAVELDGGGHGFPDQRAKDEKRNQFLAAQDTKVLRFWNHQLHGELEVVRFEIWHALMERTGSQEEIAGYLPKPAPSPQPSPPMGERESENNSRAARVESRSHSPDLRPPSPPAGERAG